MRSPEQIARSYMGTPFQHQGRTPGVGLDCAGLIICVCRELEIVEPDFDVSNYAQQPDKTSVIDACDKYLVRVKSEEMRPSDVAVIAWDSYPQHLGIVGKYPLGDGILTVIHAFCRQGEKDARVVEHRLAPFMKKQVKRVYRIPGVAWQH